MNRMCRTTYRAAIGGLVMFATACGSSESPADRAPSDQASSVSAPARSTRYASTAFVFPLEISVPDWLPARPSIDETHFLTWLGQDTMIDRAVRVMVPVNVYQPGSATATTVPEDYLVYLHTQTRHGASFADNTTTTVGGWPATITTVTTTTSLDGSLGCPAEHMTAADCYGVQPGLVLRIAVIDIDGTTLLAWARATEGNPENAEEFADFEQMLASMRFR